MKKVVSIALSLIMIICSVICVDLSAYADNDVNYRIQLTWGSTPRDLDSHLLGKDSSGNDFHLYFSKKTIVDSNGETIAKLDVDDINGYGPENTTIFKSIKNVTYGYYIYNYSGESQITSSNAKVNVYKESGSSSTLIASYSVPTSGTGRYWNIFTIKNGQITTINNISDSPLKAINNKNPETVVKENLNNINMGPYAIKGASINVLGYDIPLVDIEANIKIDLANIKIISDGSNNTIKVLIGFDQSANANISGPLNSGYWSDSYQEVKGMYQSLTGKNVDTTRLWNKYSSMRGKLKKMKSNLVIDVDSDLMGYVEFKARGNNYIFSEGGIMASFSANSSLRSYYGPCYVSLGLGIDATGALTFTNENGKANPQINVNPTFTISAGAGVGTRKTYAEIDAYGTLGADISTNSDVPLKAYVDLGVKWSGYIIGKKIFSGSKSFVKAQLYPSFSSYSMKSKINVNNKESYNKYIDSAVSLNRDYLNSKIKFYSARPTQLMKFEKKNSYPLNQPSLVSFNDGSCLLVWVDDNGLKSDFNKCSIYYSYYNGTSWSNPSIIYEDGTNSDMPYVYSDGEIAYISWQKSETIFDNDIKTSDALKEYNLYVTTFDRENLIFSEPKLINDNENEVFECNEVIYGNNGNYSLAWIENSDNNVYQQSGTNNLYAGYYTANNDSFETRKILQTENIISNLQISELGIVYSLQNGNSNDLYIYNSESTLIDSGISDFCIDNGTIYYLKNGVLNTLRGENHKEHSDICGLDNLKVVSCGNFTSLFSLKLNSDFSKTLYVSNFDESSNSFSQFEEYSDNNYYIRNYSPILLNDGIPVVAYNNIYLSDDYEYQQSTLCVEGKTDCVDLQLNYVDFENEQLNSEEINLKCEIQNNSSVPQSNIEYFVLDENGNELSSGIIDCYIDAFSKSIQNIYINIPENCQQGKISVKILPNDTSDNNIENNLVETTIQCVHNFTESGEQATCTTDGYIEYECKYCGVSKREETIVYGHDYEISVVDDKINYLCSNCLDSYSINAKQYFSTINNAKLIINDYSEFYKEESLSQLVEVFNEYHGLENKILTQNDLDNATEKIQQKIGLLEFVDSYVGIGLNEEIWEWNRNNSSITISGNVAIADYSGINVPWNVFKDVVTDIFISEGITDVGAYSFYSFSKVRNISLSDTVNTIGEYSFYNLESLEYIRIPNSVKNINDYAFSNCSALSNIDLGNGITSIGKYAFEKNTSLTDLIIPDSTTVVDYAAFDYCTNLKNVTVPATTKYGGYAFSHCELISDIRITNGSTGIMPDCTTVTSIFINKNSKGAFGPWRYADKANITLDEGIKQIGVNSFYGAKCLEEIELPDSIESIGDKAFHSCTNLKSLYIPKNVNSIGYGITSSCTNIQEIEVDKENIQFDSRDNCNAIIDSVNNSLIAGCNNTIVPNNIKVIGRNAFYGMSNLEDVILPEEIDFIEQYAFYHCTSLKSVSLPLGVTTIEPYTFSGCSELSTVELGENLTKIGNYAFSSTEKLTTIVIPEKTIEIENSAFSSSGLVTVVIPNSVTTIGNYAFNCENLTDVYYTGSSTQWGEISIGTNNTPLDNATKHYNCIFAHPTSSHKYVKTDIVEPTCIEQGYTVYTCSLCSDYYTVFDLPVGHDYGELSGKNYIAKIAKETISSTPGNKNEYYSTSTSIGSTSTSSLTSTSVAFPNQIKLDIRSIDEVEDYKFSIRGGTLSRRSCGGIFAYDASTGRAPINSAIPYTDDEGNLISMKFVDYKLNDEWNCGQYKLVDDIIVDSQGNIVSESYDCIRPHIVYTKVYALENGIMNDDGTVNATLDIVETELVTFSAGIPNVYISMDKITATTARKEFDVFTFDESKKDLIESGKYEVNLCFYNSSVSGVGKTTFKIYDKNKLQKYNGNNEYTLTCFDCGETHSELSDNSVADAIFNQIEDYTYDDYSEETLDTLKNLQSKYDYMQSSYAAQSDIDSACVELLTAMNGLEPYFILTVDGETQSYLRGESITLNADVPAGYTFVGWYDNVNNRYLSREAEYSFKITGNMDICAVFVQDNSATLTFTTYSNWIQSSVTMTIDEWSKVDSIDRLVPDVPYRYGYSNGRWVYDNSDVLAKLQKGEDVSLVPEYDEDDTSLPTPPEANGNEPVIELYYKLDAGANVGSFVMATGVPEGCEIESIGTAFYYKEAGDFDPTKFVLNVNNKMLVSRFDTDNADNIHITNINKFSDKYNWAVRGYVTYYDADGNLKTAYSNQINIVNREQV